MNPLYNPKGNYCVNCNEKFIFSFSTFEVLPLVELQFDDLSDEEALNILKENTKSRIRPIKKSTKKSDENRWYEERSQNAELLKFNSTESDDLVDLNLYADQLKLDREQFGQLNLNEVLVLDWTKPLKKQFYRNMVPEVAVTKCSFCNKFFQTDDFESQLLMHGSCSFCRTTQTVQNNKDLL